MTSTGMTTMEQDHDGSQASLSEDDDASDAVGGGRSGMRAHTCMLWRRTTFTPQRWWSR
jgi:hypothetical protein